jgi:inosose dehydratase
MNVTVANAPISYGAFELTVGIDPSVPDGNAVLDEVAAAGYRGIDLGPVGYLGEGAELAEGLARRGLGLAGAYLELPFSQPAELPALYKDLDALLDVFDAVRGAVPGPAPRPTIADAGSPERRAAPGRSASDRSYGLDAAGWTRFGEGLRSVVARCRERGYEPTLHPETGTFVEAPWEVEAAMEQSDVGVCLETGHLFVGGGDPARLASEWAGRINHVHVKDARRAVIDEIIAAGEPNTAIWSREAFCALGTGDVDLGGVFDALEAAGFDGWLVVEQDIFPQTAQRFAQAIEDQRANRRFLADHGA